MITIFNSTRYAWKIKIIEGKIACFYKDKIYNKKINDTEKKIKKSAHILAYTSLFPDKVPDLDTFVNMKTPQVLTDKNTTVIFSKKDFNPFVTEKNEPVKNILLVSVPIRKGYKVTDIFTEDVFILDGYILGGELTLIASFNSDKAKMKVTTFDPKTNHVSGYTFSASTDGIKVTTDINTVTEEKKEEFKNMKPFKLKVFRPAKPTYTILVYRQDKNKLQNVIDVNKHNVVEITNKTSIDTIKNLLKENYKAVTIFVDAEEFGQTQQKIYGNLLRKLFTTSVDKKKMNIINLLLNNKKIIKKKKY